MSSIVTVRSDHAEGLTLAALEMATGRVAAATGMVNKIGRDTEHLAQFVSPAKPDSIRRKFAARAVREAITQLEAAAALLEAGQ